MCTNNSHYFTDEIILLSMIQATSFSKYKINFIKHNCKYLIRHLYSGQDYETDVALFEMFKNQETGLLHIGKFLSVYEILLIFPKNFKVYFLGGKSYRPQKD